MFKRTKRAAEVETEAALSIFGDRIFEYDGP